MVETCPKFIKFWLLLSSVVVTWDAAFVLLRPKTLPGGELHKFFQPYALYIQVDLLYGNMQDDFVYFQSCLNVAEIVLNMVALIFLTRTNMKHYTIGSILSLIVCSFTFWKTVLYSLYGFRHATHNTWDLYIFCYIIPNSVWIIVPFICIVTQIKKFSQVDYHKIKTN